MFEKGHTKLGGRSAGKENKRTTAIREYMDKRKVNPAFFCIDILAGDNEAVGKEIITFEDRQWAVETLLPYVEGKRKPVDSEGSDKGDPITDALNELRGR